MKLDLEQNLDLEHFHLSDKPTPKPSLICFLSLLICSLWAFRVEGNHRICSLLYLLQLSMFLRSVYHFHNAFCKWLLGHLRGWGLISVAGRVDGQQ